MINTTRDNLQHLSQASDQHMKDTACNVTTRAGQKLRNLLCSARDEMTYAQDKAIEEIRSNPLRSSIAALALGVLVGNMLHRR